MQTNYLPSVYLDKNIYSFLKNRDILPNEEKRNLYKDLFSLLTKLKSNDYEFPYSIGHINDLKTGWDKNEKSISKTFEDLIFINQITFGLLLEKYYDNEEPIASIKSPSDYFRENKETNFNDFLDFDLENILEKMGDSPLIAPLKTVLNLNLDFSEIIKNLDEPTKEVLKAYLPQNENSISLQNLGDKVLKNSQTLFAENNAYRDLRNYIHSNLKGNYKVGDNGEDIFEIDKALEDSIFKKSLKTFITDIVKPSNPKLGITRYDTILMIFSIFDILGISKEKSSKLKGKGFQTVFKDAQHAYFSSYCSFLVTDDIELRRKMKAIKKLIGDEYDFQTEILDVNEFMNLYE
jgi:hypothetical protein